LVDVTKLKPQPEVGWVRAADGSFAPPPPYVPTARERMDAAMAAGFSLSSTATPSLNATYDVAGQRWQQMLGEAPYITAFGSFSGGVTKLDWPARSGEVVFATTAEFLAVVRALADQLTLWQRFVDGKGEEPASEVTVP
jgi:hypothetical protein